MDEAGRFVLITASCDSTESSVIGDASDLGDIRLHEGVTVTATKWHGTWAAPGGTSARLEVKGTGFLVFKGPKVDRPTIAGIIATLEQSGDPQAKANLKVLRALAAAFAAWDKR